MSEDTNFIRRKLPGYWKLATIRCSIYASVVGWGAFMTGTEGYDAFSQMTTMQVIKLSGGVIATMLGVWLAFLDQTLTKISSTSAEINSVTVTAENKQEIKTP